MYFNQTEMQETDTDGKTAPRPPLLRKQTSMRQEKRAAAQAASPKAVLLPITLGLALASGGYSQGSNDIDFGALFASINTARSPVRDGYERMLIRNNGGLDQNIKKFDHGWYLNYEWSTEDVSHAELLGGVYSGVVDHSRIMYDLGTTEMKEYLRSANINGVITFFKLKYQNKGFSEDARSTIDALVKGMERDCARANEAYNRTGYQGREPQHGMSLANGVSLMSVLPQLYDAPVAAPVLVAAPRRTFVWEYNSRNSNDIWSIGSASRARWTAYPEDDQQALEYGLTLGMDVSVANNMFRVNSLEQSPIFGSLAYQQADYGTSPETEFDFVQVGGSEERRTFRPVRRRSL